MITIIKLSSKIYYRNYCVIILPLFTFDFEAPDFGKEELTQPPVFAIGVIVCELIPWLNPYGGKRNGFITENKKIDIDYFLFYCYCSTKRTQND